MDKILTFIKQKPLLAIAIVLPTLAIIYGGYLALKSSDEAQRKQHAVPVEVEEVRVGSLTRTITAVGTLRANQMVELRAEVAGIVTQVNVRGGEYVEPGTLLFTLDDRSFRAEVQSAEAQLTNARLAYERAQKLSANQLTTNKKTFAEAEAGFKIAEAKLERAESDLAKTKIRAPFEGIVGIHNLSVGSHIDSNKEILTLVDVTPIKVDFRIPAEYLPYVSTGQKVSVVVDGFGKTPFPGLIEAIDSKVDPVTHSIGARAVVPNKKNLLKPGLFARVDVVVGAKDHTLIVPTAALEKQGDQEMVYKVVEGLAIHVPVITGIQEGDNIEVVRGLNPGDHVVTVGQMKIRDNTPVRYTLNGKDYAFDEEAFKKLLEKAKDKSEGKEAPKEEAKAEEQPAAAKPDAPTAADKVAETKPQEAAATPAADKPAEAKGDAPAPTTPGDAAPAPEAVPAAAPAPEAAPATDGATATPAPEATAPAVPATEGAATQTAPAALAPQDAPKP
ncbi:MAG: efflux RND transporter periplasmic adaptor subunit [Proteobacteria bacterium]|nr:efflux RND transporter periplasmic adaptor subunit [Pseudomonadota bacterium]